MVRRKRKLETEENSESKKKNLYPVDDLLFKSRQDYVYFLKLEEKQAEGLIDSFDPSSLLVPPDETDFTETQTKTKYNARKIIINNIVLDSRLEADYYLHLLGLKKEKNIVDFTLKPKFVLQPSFKKNGKKFASITYIADFSVEYPDGDLQIVDTKGVITADFSLKKKIFEYNFPDLELRVLKYVKSRGGWVDHDEDRKLKKQLDKENTKSSIKSSKKTKK